MAWDRDLISFHIKTDLPSSHKYFYFKGLGPVCFGPLRENLSRLRGIFTICMNLCNFNSNRDKLLLLIKAGNFICSSEHRVHVLPWPWKGLVKRYAKASCLPFLKRTYKA